VDVYPPAVFVIGDVVHLRARLANRELAAERMA